MTWAVVPAAGQGRRFGAERPEVKAFADWLLRTAERESAQQG